MYKSGYAATVIWHCTFSVKSLFIYCAFWFHLIYKSGYAVTVVWRCTFSVKSLFIYCAFWFHEQCTIATMPKVCLFVCLFFFFFFSIIGLCLFGGLFLLPSHVQSVRGMTLLDPGSFWGVAFRTQYWATWSNDYRCIFKLTKSLGPKFKNHDNG